MLFIIIQFGAGRRSTRSGLNISVLLEAHSTAAAASTARSSRWRRRHRISARPGRCTPPPRLMPLCAARSATRLPWWRRRRGITTSPARSTCRGCIGMSILAPHLVATPRRGGFAVHDAHRTALQKHHPFARAGRSTQKLHDWMA
jgi:hypothetical protein